MTHFPTITMSIFSHECHKCNDYSSRRSTGRGKKSCPRRRRLEQSTRTIPTTILTDHLQLCLMIKHLFIFSFQTTTKNLLLLYIFFSFLFVFGFYSLSVCFNFILFFKKIIYFFLFIIQLIEQF